MPYPGLAVTHGSAHLGATGTDRGSAGLLTLVLILYLVIRVRGKPEHGSIVWTTRMAPVLPLWMHLLEKLLFGLCGEFCNSI